MIVFGWNSFTVATYKPSDIGMEAELDKQIYFERRQKYAHLFWIPFFGIGQIWVFRKVNDPNKYQPHPDIEKVLQYKYPTHKTPWYTFALPLLAVAGGILFVIGMQIEDYQSGQRHQAYLAEKNALQTSTINNPPPGTYFHMDGKERDVFLKVLGSDQRSLTCLVSTPSVSLYGDDAVLEAFIDDGTRFFDTAVIPKEDLLKTINSTDDYSFAGFEIIPGEGNITLSEVKIFSSPVFRSLGAAFEEGKFKAVVHNIGETGKFKAFNMEPGPFQLVSEFPEVINQGDTLVFYGVYSGMEPGGTGKLELESLTNDMVPYKVLVSGSRIYISPNTR